MELVGELSSLFGVPESLCVELFKKYARMCCLPVFCVMVRKQRYKLRKTCIEKKTVDLVVTLRVQWFEIG